MGRGALAALVLCAAAACGHQGPAVAESTAPDGVQEQPFYVAVVNRCTVQQAVCVSLEEPDEDSQTRQLAPDETAIQKLHRDERVWRMSHGEWRPAGWFADAPADGGAGRVELHCGI